MLTPFAVMDAPELAALALLEHAIDVARVAVLAQHIDLIDPDAPSPCSPLPGADLTALFFARAYALSTVIWRYRAALAPTAGQSGPAKPDDDF